MRRNRRERKAAAAAAANRRRARRRPKKGRRRRFRSRQPLHTDEQILEAFRTAGHPVAFSAPGTVARFFGISKKRATRLLQQVDSYVLHKEFKRPANYNPYYVYKRRELIQTDLIDMRDLRAANDNVSFLLLLIDVFSRKVWVYPLERKTAVAVAAALRAWLDGLKGKRKVKAISHDSGAEYLNAPVRKLLAERGIEQRIALGTSKACYAERANKTIQVLIYKWLSDRETTRYIDQLPKIVETYNKRGHRSLQFMTPEEADRPRNETYVRGLNMQRAGRVKRKKPKLELGDTVRVKTESSKISSSRRAYAEQYKGEYFTIVRINRRLPIPLYYLKSLDTGELIRGSFYESELSKVRGDVFKVEQVIKTRKRPGTRGKKRDLYVKWKWFSPGWNSWVREEDVVQVF
jgi:transposase InsO family protein